jgi:competence protein ComEA
MRSRRSVDDEVAEVARRRLELLRAELAEIRPESVDPPIPGDGDGSGGERPPPAAGTAPVPGRHAHRPVGPGAAVGGWVQDRLPAPLQGRVQLSAAHLVVVLLLVIGGLGATAWWVTRADGGERPVPSLSSAPPVAASSLVTPSVAAGGAPTAGAASTGTTPGPTAPGRSPTVTGNIVVDVAGKVHRPGIATLPSGSRVVDALEAAGGARRGVRLGSLNLARVLVDGEQIVVGVAAPPGVAASAASAPTSGAGVPMVNINTATQAELEELPGVGPVTAQSILEFRAEHGTFTAVDELLEVSGIGDATLAKIAPYVTL